MIELSDKEQVLYLANSFFVAYIDSSLSPKELAALDDIRAKIGAKKSSLALARKAVEAGTYAVSKCGNFVAQVSNLADMMYICFVGGELSDKEQIILSSFSEAIGLSAAQFDLMLKEAAARASKELFKVSCPKCLTEADSKSKFCPNCGTELSKAPEEAVQTNFEIPKVGHVIEFSESTASGFTKALELAKQAPKFESCIRAKKTWYLTSWPEQAFIDVTHLADALGGIRNRRYYNNGTEVDWNETFAFVWCVEKRNAAYRPIEYCFGKDDNRINPWGCRQIELDWTEWARWFSYGQFIKSGVFKNKYTWVFDKERIRHEVMTNLHRYRHCPHIRPVFIEAVLKALPDEVEISPGCGWKYNSIYEEVPGCIKVIEIEKSGGYEFKREYFSDGIRPLGLSSLQQVLSKAFTEAKVNDISVDLIAK
jgi:hypothetical protein